MKKEVDQSESKILIDHFSKKKWTSKNAGASSQSIKQI